MICYDFESWVNFYKCRVHLLLIITIHLPLPYCANERNADKMKLKLTSNASCGAKQRFILNRSRCSRVTAYGRISTCISLA